MTKCQHAAFAVHQNLTGPEGKQPNRIGKKNIQALRQLETSQGFCSNHRQCAWRCYAEIKRNEEIPKDYT